jgi:DNA-binding transcriptional LysR family regulator
MSEDLNAMAVFAAVAEARGFRAAGLRLGVSASAVSQTLRKLETQLGVVLLQRTSRSVRLTAAGEQLYAAVRPALAEVRAAVAALGELGDAPRGTIRLYAADAVEPFLRGTLLADFLAENPHVDLDVTVGDVPVDIVAAGHDAGVQLGEVIDRDMIAVPVSGDVRLVVVASPAYLARRGRPRHPRDLAEHDIVNWRPSGESAPYRWEFTEAETQRGADGEGLRSGRDFAVSVRARVLTTDAALMLGLARAGAGVAMLWEGQVRDDVARGDLVPVLEEFSTPFPGFYLYYPQRRQASAALRALIDHLRAARKPTKSSATQPRAGRTAGAVPGARPPREVKHR